MGHSPLQLAIRPSVSLTAFLFAGHFVAGLVVASLAARHEVLWGLLLPVVVSLIVQVGKLWYRPVCFLKTTEDGRVELQMDSGITVSGHVLGDSVVLPGLIILLVKSAARNKIHSLVLPVDALGADGHRCLRRWLVWRSQQITGTTKEQKKPADAG